LELLIEIYGGEEVLLAIGLTYMLGFGLLVYWGLDLAGIIKHDNNVWERLITAAVLILGVILIVLFLTGEIPIIK
jgi:hypothetical protein